MKELILLRGIPGAGKSTLAKMICNHYFEADMFFIQDGQYKFDASKLKQAHQWCYDKTKECMKKGYNVAVSNTFTQEWEMKTYYELAKEFNYRVHSIIVENRHGGINAHGVPDYKLQLMKDRFEIKL